MTGATARAAGRRPDRAWLDWETDGQAWPNRAASRFVAAGGFDWHVQIEGPQDGPIVLLLHGTGASCHSWAPVMPLLCDRFRLIVPDLPCHGFTRPQGPPDLSLPGMTEALRRLLAELGLRPMLIAGHSAGAAIAVALAARPRRVGRGPTDPPGTGNGTGIGAGVVGVNGAFLPIRGNRLLSPMAKALFANPFSSAMFSALARSTALGTNLLQATGSAVPPASAALYRRLLSSSGHVRGALGMMAAWDLGRFDALLSRVDAPVTLIAARDDPMVPPRNSEHAAAVAAKGRLILTGRGGHLLHECQPEPVAGWIGEAVHQTQQHGADVA